MTNTQTIKGIKYNVLAEELIFGIMSEQGFYKTMLILVRPKGNKRFSALRDINGELTIY